MTLHTAGKAVLVLSFVVCCVAGCKADSSLPASTNSTSGLIPRPTWSACRTTATLNFLTCQFQHMHVAHTAGPDCHSTACASRWNSPLAVSHDVSPNDPFELTLRNSLCLAAACVCALLANSAGVGGGPFYMPLFHVGLGFDIKSSTALSHTVVASSAVISTLYGLLHARPTDPTRPLVDLDIALIFIPALLFGVSLGVLGNTLFPEWLQTLLLTLLLSWVVFKTFRRAQHQWRLEQAARQRTRDAEAAANGPAAASEKLHSKQHVEEEIEGRLRRDWAGVLARVPWVKLLQVVALWAAFMALQVGKSRARTCSTPYWAYYGGQALLCAGVTALYAALESGKLRRGDPDTDPELRRALMDGQGGLPAAAGGGGEGGAGHSGSDAARRRAVATMGVVVGVMVAAGALAGLLGIGGALIFNPFLLSLGVHPQVVASTAVLMIAFSSASISLSLYLKGLLNTSYAAVFAPTCMAAALIGVTIVGRLVRRTGRPSILIWILAALIAAGTVSTAVFGGLRALEELRSGRGTGFQPLCPPAKG